MSPWHKMRLIETWVEYIHVYLKQFTLKIFIIIKLLFCKVPGRMGLLITLSLISWNVYGSLKAPPSRGFSNIELWITGEQCIIIYAILEYACILALKRSQPSKASFDYDKVIKMTDLISLLISLIFFIIFNIIYWKLM